MFTLPAEFADIALHNKAVIYDLLFRAASDTMLTIAADPWQLSARIGMTVILHSWGATLTRLRYILPIATSSRSGSSNRSGRAGAARSASAHAIELSSVQVPAG
jgi:hypothetical protein